MSIWKYASGAALLALTGCATPTARAPHVVVISIDGMRPDSYLQADAYGLRIPTLRSLMARGRYAEGMTSVYPSVTFPAHTTMVTGVNPAVHGISANTSFDPWMVNQGGWNWYAESIHAETLWTAAHRAGLTSGAIFWPVSVGARDLDFYVPQFWRVKDDEDIKLLRAVSSPGFYTELEEHGEGGIGPAESRSDKERSEAAIYLLREKKPALSLLYFGDLDSEQHRTGPLSPTAKATLETIDGYVGKAIAATVAAGTFDQTTFVVVSDHGFRAVATETRPSVWLEKAGLIVRDRPNHVLDWQAAALPAGGTCGIVLRDPKNDALKAKVLATLQSLAADPANGIARIVSATDLATAGGFPEASFALEAANGFELVGGIDEPAARPSSHHGTHGYPPSDPDMRASFLAAGPGISPGPELPLVRMIDVAPTVARILHLSLPQAEGQPIAALFAH